MKNAASFLHPDFAAMFSRITREFIEQWWETPISFPEGLAVFTRREQKAKGRELDAYLNRAAGQLSAEVTAAAREANLKSAARAFAAQAFAGDWEGRDPAFLDDFATVTEDFVHEARRFDPGLKMDDVAQALRNLWIGNSLQVYLEKPVTMTPGLFAYSMLYPYTDNYLDDASVPADGKQGFSRWFAARLAGEPVAIGNEYQDKLSRLVAMVEEQYSRVEYRDVYQSLLAIHQAQEDALTQQNRTACPYETDLLGLSFAKGGASVLADGYLVKGDLTEAEMRFVMGFGIFLQLIDDLQDLPGDRRHGHMTVFSQVAGGWPLDNLTNRLLRFTSDVLDGTGRFVTPQNQQLKSLIAQNCLLLIQEAISRQKGFFCRSYLGRMQACLPLRPRAMAGIARKVKKLRGGFKSGWDTEA